MKQIEVEHLIDYPIGTRFYSENEEFVYLCLLDDPDIYTGIYALDKDRELQIFELYTEVLIQDDCQPKKQIAQRKNIADASKVYKFQDIHDGNMMYIIGKDDKSVEDKAKSLTGLKLNLLGIMPVDEVAQPWVVHNKVLPF